MKTEIFNQRLLAYTRVTGPYGENYEAAITRLYQWASSKGLSEGESIFIYHDNPEITPADECRTDICLSVPAGTTVSDGIELQELPEGNYASIRKDISSKNDFATFWGELIGKVVQAKLTMGEGPCFELYHSYNPETHTGDVSFYTAVRA